MPITYSDEEIQRWKATHGTKLVREMTGRGQSTHHYIVRTNDNSPLPSDDQVLICFADGWWWANFGGNVRRISESNAYVDVYVD